MLAEPATTDEITDLISDEHGLDPASVRPTVREAALVLWSAGVSALGSNEPPPLPASTVMPPNT